MTSVARSSVAGRITQQPANENHRPPRPPLADDLVAELVRLRPGLLSRALFLVQDPWAAEDLVQEVLERAIVARARFQRGTHLKAWLASIMRNLFIDGCRRAAAVARSRVEQQPEPEWLPDEDADGPIQLLGADDVMDALALLDPAQREAFILACLEGLSYQQIAARVGVPTSTVGTRLLRAKKKLRRLLEEVYQQRRAPKRGARAGLRSDQSSESTA